MIDLLDDLIIFFEARNNGNATNEFLNRCNKEKEKKLKLCVVTGSFGAKKEPTLTTLKRTDENRHITVCDLCIFSAECEFNEIRYNKCITDNTDEQYYL